MNPYLTIGVITAATLLALVANILVVVAACGTCTGSEVLCLLGVACFGDVVAWLCWTGK